MRIESFRVVIRLVLPLIALGLTGCATAPGRTTSEDPWQGFNRGVYRFNDTVDKATLKPIAKGYRKITPEWFRTGVGNFFDNIDYPWTIVNQLMQGKPKLALQDTGRFLVNSTIGLAGLLDVASRMNITEHDEDFGQTLAVWGVPSGPYLVLPFFGPSNLRDGPSRVADYFGGTLSYVDLKWEEEWTLRVLEIVDDRTRLMQLESTLDNAYDKYGVMRDAWTQRREFQVFDGDPPIEIPEDEFGDEEASAP